MLNVLTETFISDLSLKLFLTETAFIFSLLSYVAAFLQKLFQQWHKHVAP